MRYTATRTSIAVGLIGLIVLCGALWAGGTWLALHLFGNRPDLMGFLRVAFWWMLGGGAVTVALSGCLTKKQPQYGQAAKPGAVQRNQVPGRMIGRHLDVEA